ncbi:hypothetical protein WR25_09353 [Diploscapter pachys]|uniref:Uncharacterized protein n=1 Tax=Diploscapter pachys TaxID=2018661 RepID=A0A2A2L530_9BILA|nr:hypothetical protein WR25_09353 [Diploscapter pachys]
MPEYSLSKPQKPVQELRYNQPFPYKENPYSYPSNYICSNRMERDKGKEKPPSRSNSDESIGTRPVSVTVVRDTGTKVQLMLKAHGMKKKKSFFGSILTAFKKPHTPSKLVENGRFTRFDLKDHSLGLTLEVQTNKKKKKSNENRVDTFVCDIKQFPTGINPDSAEFEASLSS